MKILRVLMVEDSDADAEWMRRAVARPATAMVELERASTLADALVLLRQNVFDAVLLDLSLPDSNALHSVLRIRDHFPDIALVLLSGDDDERFALDAIVAGAQDYLVKGDETTPRLVRAIRYAVARSRAVAGLRSGLLCDPLTGFYTAAGFSAVADSYLGSIDYSREKPALVYLELDGIEEGSADDATEFEAMMLDAAAAISRAFGEDAVYAVLERGQFAALVKNRAGDPEIALLGWVWRGIEQHNRKSRRHRLSFKASVVNCGVAASRVIEETLDRAKESVVPLRAPPEWAAGQERDAHEQRI
jgi:DNA-binding response OmpR family regulator